MSRFCCGGNKVKQCSQGDNSENINSLKEENARLKTTLQEREENLQEKDSLIRQLKEQIEQLTKKTLQQREENLQEKDRIIRRLKEQIEQLTKNVPIRKGDCDEKIEKIEKSVIMFEDSDGRKFNFDATLGTYEGQEGNETEYKRHVFNDVTPKGAADQMSIKNGDEIVLIGVNAVFAPQQTHSSVIEYLRKEVLVSGRSWSTMIIKRETDWIKFEFKLRPRSKEADDSSGPSTRTCPFSTESDIGPHVVAGTSKQTRLINREDVARKHDLPGTSERNYPVSMEPEIIKPDLPVSSKRTAPVTMASPLGDGLDCTTRSLHMYKADGQYLKHTCDDRLTSEKIKKHQTGYSRKKKPEWFRYVEDGNTVSFQFMSNSKERNNDLPVRCIALDHDSMVKAKDGKFSWEQIPIKGGVDKYEKKKAYCPAS